MPYRTSKRVRTIYSVIASSNRLDILRILNAKGPLSYSELKTLAGFKSKKESGKSEKVPSPKEILEKYQRQA